MTGNDIRTKYLEFFRARGHAIVPSSPLVPENDPTTLFTGSGMQPMLSYLLGEAHPKGTRIADSQKSFRSEDIEEVGDNRHTTFFEMLGNWSFGDYFKREQIEWIYEFLTKEIGLAPNRLYITVFGGDKEYGLPKDEESPKFWQGLFARDGIDADIAHIGSEADGYARGIKGRERIFYYEAKKNWWSRAGIPARMPAGEPGGPDSEMFYDFGTEHDPKYGEHCHPNCDCGRFMEIGNNVFMQYVKKGNGTFAELERKNIDFGGGLERILAAALHNSQDIDDVFRTDLLYPLIEQTEKLSGKTYKENEPAFRVIADHIRGAAFLIADGVYPDNKDRGYFVRRLLRRSVRYADILGVPAGELKNLAESVIEIYGEHYTDLRKKKDDIMRTIADEEARFRKTLQRGLKVLQNYYQESGAHDRLHNEQRRKVLDASPRRILPEEIFTTATTYGFPIELIREELENEGIVVTEDDWKEVGELMERHQQLSRSGSEQKFKGGLADHSEKVVRYHTATHLLLAALRKELGGSVHQAGSNITGERARFDFTYPEKVSRDTLDRVERYVNEAIRSGAAVTKETLSKEDAKNNPGIEGSFWEKYPDRVDVYTVTGPDGTVYSRELCGGPHVTSTAGMGTLKIVKEEAVAAGVRRIRAILE